MTAAVIYTRFSPRPNADECDSNEKQEERCIAYCGTMGYRIVGSFPDPDVSGGVLDRPGLQKAIEFIGAMDGEEKVLVVDSVNRLARDMLVNLTIRHEVERIGARIEFADRTPISDTPEGRLMSNILAAFAAYERDRTRYATSRGMKRRQKNGEWFGKPPVGWMRDPEDSKKLIPHPGEQEAIKHAKLLAASGVASKAIANTLTRYFCFFRGRPWSARTVRKILANDNS